MAKICTIGSATQDIFINVEDAETMHLLLKPEIAPVHERSFLLFEQGRKIDVPQLHYAVGGGATNSAVTFKRLGHNVHSFFNTAKDSAGDFIRATLAKEGLYLILEPIDSIVGTAQSFIFPTTESNHVVFCYRGVNRLLGIQSFPLELLTEIDYLYFSSLSGQSRALLPDLSSQARPLGVVVACNPGMGQLAHEVDEFIKALGSIDIVQVNAFEARTLFGALMTHANLSKSKHREKNSIGPKLATTAKNQSSAKVPPLLEHFVSLQEQAFTIIDYCAELFKHGPTTLVVTDGAYGVYVAKGDTLYFHPPVHTNIVSALGAGDAFGSAFVSALAYDKDIETAIVYGVLNAAAVLESLDAQAGILTLAELEARVDKLGQGFLEKYLLV